jgi:hypothetical protein
MDCYPKCTYAIDIYADYTNQTAVDAKVIDGWNQIKSILDIWI